MKRAWMLLLPAWIAIAFGCNNGQYGLFGPSSRPADRNTAATGIVSEPISVAPPTSAPAEVNKKEATSSDPKAASVGQRIEQYLNGLQAKDANGGNKAESPSDASPQTRPASNVQQKPSTKPAPAKSIDSTILPPRRPTLAAATQPAAAGNSSVMASPKPPALRPPTPTGAVSEAAPRGPRVSLVDVRPAVRPGQPVTTAPSAASPNRPAVAAALGPLPSDMAAMIRQLEETVSKNPELLDDQLKLRLLYLVTGQDEKAIAPIQLGDPVQAEFITALLKTLRNSKNMIVDPASKDPSALAAVDELRRLLGQQLPVSIPRIALVTRINSFGDYQAINPPKFTAGRGIHVFLYTEVYNFRSQPTDDGKLHTVLSEKVEIFDSSGKIIWDRSEPSIVDRVVTPRRDFFIPFPINLPGELPAGDYILKVTVEDKLGATADQQKLTFTVGQ
jgi:hypothetical protein